MPEKFIKQVTVTGADDSVNYYDLYVITRQYPYVEWGILLSKSSEGYPRFPSPKWIEGFITEKPPSVHVSGHLCGAWVRDIVAGGTEFIGAKSNVLDGFERFQLNFHAQSHRPDYPARFIHALELLTVVGRQQLIFQWDGVNSKLYHLAKSQYGQQCGLNAVVLYDTSGGAGILPEEWPEPMGDYCGYAGGLSPFNLSEQIELIRQRIIRKDGSLPTIWVDAETYLRTPDNARFDLDKVVKFLELAEPNVIRKEGE